MWDSLGSQPVRDNASDGETDRPVMGMRVRCVMDTGKVHHYIGVGTGIADTTAF